MRHDKDTERGTRALPVKQLNEYQHYQLFWSKYFDTDRCERRAATDQVGSLLGDHDDRVVDVAADEVRHH
jgi:hypothetical protein